MNLKKQKNKRNNVKIEEDKIADSEPVKIENNDHQQQCKELYDQLDIVKGQILKLEKEGPIGCDKVSSKTENKVCPHCLNIYCEKGLLTIIQNFGACSLCKVNIDKEAKLQTDKTYKSGMEILQESMDSILEKIAKEEQIEKCFCELHHLVTDVYCKKCKKVHGLKGFKENVINHDSYLSVYDHFLEKVEIADNNFKEIQEFLGLVDQEKELLKKVQSYDKKELKKFVDIFIDDLK